MTTETWIVLALAAAGWVGSLLALSFAFGRRVQRLEDADTRLTNAVEALTKVVNGHSGNLALAAATKAATDALAELARRQSMSEAEFLRRHDFTETHIHLHEVRLARLDEMRGALETAVRDFYERKWDPLVAHTSTLQAQLQAMSLQLERLTTLLTKDTR